MKIGSRVVIDEVDGLPTTRSGSGIIVSAQDKCFYVGVESWVDGTAECSGNKATCPRHGRAKEQS